MTLFDFKMNSVGSEIEIACVGFILRTDHNWIFTCIYFSTFSQMRRGDCAIINIVCVCLFLCVSVVCLQECEQRCRRVGQVCLSPSLSLSRIPTLTPLWPLLAVARWRDAV